MDLHFEFNKKIKKKYYSKVINGKGDIVASKITDEKVNVDDFVLRLINNEELSLDFRKELKDAYINRETNENKEVINKTCTSIVLCLNDNQDELNCSRLIVRFNDGTRIRFNIDIEKSFNFDHLNNILFTKIKEIEILEDCVVFTIIGFNKNESFEFDIRLNIKVISFYWRN